MAEAVNVPASQAATPPSHSTLTGAELPQAKEGLRLGTQGPFGRVQLFATLWPVACQASLSGRGRSPGKNTGACWPILVPCPSRALYLLLPSLPTPLSTWCCQNPCNPSSCTTSTPGFHWGRPKPSRADTGANPSGQPRCRGGNETTVETQGQCD